MNQNTMLLIVVTAVLLALLVLIIILLAAQNSRIRRERIQQEKGVDRLNQAMGHSLRQMAELSGALDARMEALTRQNDEKLTEMRRVVGESLDGRLSQSFRVVNSQLADVHRGIGEMKELAANVTDLK